MNFKWPIAWKIWWIQDIITNESSLANLDTNFNSTVQRKPSKTVWNILDVRHETQGEAYLTRASSQVCKLQSELQRTPICWKFDCRARASERYRRLWFEWYLPKRSWSTNVHTCKSQSTLQSHQQLIYHRWQRRSPINFYAVVSSTKNKPQPI